jgi:hypothetical protein
MKIEFRKVPQTAKDFDLEINSVKFCGTFGKISSKLVDIKSSINGDIEIQCCKCGSNFIKIFDENINFLISDGIYSLNDKRDLDKIIIEIDNNLIDFEEILQGELESFKSDYHICNTCLKDNSTIDLKY